MTIINDLKILREFKKNHRTYYEFECVCGNLGKAQKRRIVSGHTKSCGCRRARNRVKKTTPLLPTDSVENKLYNQYVRDANNRGIDFSIKKSVFLAITKLACHYCNSDPLNKIEFRNEFLLWNGLDRVDSSKDYTKDNVLPCCTKCNRAKHTLSKMEFLKHIEKIYLNNFGPQ